MAEVKVKKTTEKKVVKAARSTGSGPVRKAVVKEVVVKAAPKAEKAVSLLTVDVYGLDGKVSGKVSLPEEMFGEKVNKTLLAQAVRVYLANKRQGTVSTKTRREVDGSTRKIYRQKGTGKARHGSIRAPIFVKGGIVFGPKPRDYSLALPKKMKRKALFSALSAKLQDGQVKLVSGFDKMSPKTKEFVAAMNNLGVLEKKRKLLFVMGQDLVQLKRAANNLQGVSLTAANRLNAYDVLNNKDLVVMKEALDEMKKFFVERSAN